MTRRRAMQRVEYDGPTIVLGYHHQKQRFDS